MIVYRENFDLDVDVNKEFSAALMFLCPTSCYLVVPFTRYLYIVLYSVLLASRRDIVGFVMCTSSYCLDNCWQWCFMQAAVEYLPLLRENC